MAPAPGDAETASMRFHRTHRAARAATRPATLDTAHGWLPCRGITMSRFTALAAAVATASLLAGVYTTLQAQPEPSLADVSLPRLKSMVLHCDLHPSVEQGLTFTTAFCAFATDELRGRAFDGDQEQLLGWLRDERARLELDATPAPEQGAARATPLPGNGAGLRNRRAVLGGLRSAEAACVRGRLRTPACVVANGGQGHRCTRHGARRSVKGA
jgi:hypothetical protein